MTGEDLKPCPFCGFEAGASEREAHKNDGWWRVDCSECGAAIVGEWSEKTAAAMWNRRQYEAAPPISEEVIGRMAAIIEPWAMGRAECDQPTLDIRSEAFAKAREIAALLSLQGGGA